MSIHRTLGILAAHFGSPLARIRASILFTGGTQRTIRMVGTFVRIAAAALERITDKTGGTCARETAERVLAMCGRMTYGLDAFVDVLAHTVGLHVIALQAGTDGFVVLHTADATGTADLIARICEKLKKSV